MSTYSLQSKFSENVLIPKNGIDEAYFADRAPSGSSFRTTDGRESKAEFISFWDNHDGRYDEELDDFCRRFYGVGFDYIRSIWISRLDTIEECWYRIRLYD